MRATHCLLIEQVDTETEMWSLFNDFRLQNHLNLVFRWDSALLSVSLSLIAFQNRRLFKTIRSRRRNSIRCWFSAFLRFVCFPNWFRTSEQQKQKVPRAEELGKCHTRSHQVHASCALLTPLINFLSAAVRLFVCYTFELFFPASCHLCDLHIKYSNFCHSVSIQFEYGVKYAQARSSNRGQGQHTRLWGSTCSRTPELPPESAVRLMENMKLSWQHQPH